MKLYFAPNTCSLSPHIVLHELGLPFDLVRVNNKTKHTSEGGNFLDINPKGYVAALVLDNGEVLTEGPAILQYLADLKPEAQLAPPAGSWARVRLQETLNFITAEIHAGCSPLFNTALPEDVKSMFREKLFKRLDTMEAALAGRDYLHGRFGVADAYLYTVLAWLPLFSIDIARWPGLARFMARIGARAAVKAALAAEDATLGC
ncbi:MULTISPECIES: glutathione transferase GstA [unclassified Burkholderia]|uniref:glutathione transferase GstA n=1 Tax=unclassified Burkholderia TaxID=2613784 RepID=UPI0014232DED|nr:MULTISPECIES: glutathione transferase GstA [unclassified Burkholderia]NIE82581.1 glutathione transferase GstA [Burkholderia sp. Tr-860]NIF61965.1 glutathione transferase GstA [Burkholderia sp. Cy-647]NIF95614.1 glutathione transferase GstA [Burkholderia sp. Ax-1720]